MIRPSINQLPLAKSANAALERFKAMAGLGADSKSLNITGASLLYERAFMLGLKPQGAISANGSCHLIPCKGGILALNLPRDSDWELIPAWLSPCCNDLLLRTLPTQWQLNDWETLTAICKQLDYDALLNQAQYLGLAVAPADQQPTRSPAPSPEHPEHNAPFTRPPFSNPPFTRPPLVLDFSSLWAGPLCSHLLQQAGCDVIKIESTQRLDGARNGSPDFYRLLNQAKQSITLDFTSTAAIEQLKALINKADLVIEASRPHGLINLGINPEHEIKNNPNLTWLSITAYGRSDNNAMKIGFGDDVAAASGLCQLMHEATGTYQWAGDAIADPLTGIQGALLAMQALTNNSNTLIDLAMKDVVSALLIDEINENKTHLLDSLRHWHTNGSNLSLYFPSGARKPHLPSAAPGAHNKTVFSAPTKHVEA